MGKFIIIVVLVVVGLLGCATDPRTAAAQRMAVGGGLVAVGVVGAVGGAIGTGAAVTLTDGRARDELVGGLVGPVVVGVAVDVGIIVIGSVMMSGAGEEMFPPTAALHPRRGGRPLRRQAADEEPAQGQPASVDDEADDDAPIRQDNTPEAPDF